MTQEEKAKAYDNVHEKIAARFGSNVAQEIFSEYEESEDERIRKALIKFHKSSIDIDGIKGNDIIDWLEKQGASYTKRDVDDAYVEGMAFAKDELEKQGQKPTEWSEEDENVLADIEEAIINYWHGDTQDILLDWLKSLKQRTKTSSKTGEP